MVKAMVLAAALPISMDVPSFRAAVAERMDEVTTESWEFVSLDIRPWSSTMVDIRDWRLGINVSGSRFGDSVSFHGDFFGSARPIFLGSPELGVSLSGDGMSVDYRTHSSGGWLTGTIVENNRATSLNMNVSRLGDGYSVFGDGSSLQIRKSGDGWRIDGNIDTARFGKRKLIALACAFSASVQLSTNRP